MERPNLKHDTDQKANLNQVERTGLLRGRAWEHTSVTLGFAISLSPAVDLHSSFGNLNVGYGVHPICGLALWAADPGRVVGRSLMDRYKDVSVGHATSPPCPVNGLCRVSDGEYDEEISPILGLRHPRSLMNSRGGVRRPAVYYTTYNQRLPSNLSYLLSLRFLLSRHKHCLLQG